jgi:hypothetical protein
MTEQATADFGLESARKFLEVNQGLSDGRRDTACTYIAVLLDVIDRRDKTIEKMRQALHGAHALLTVERLIGPPEHKFEVEARQKAHKLVCGEIGAALANGESTEGSKK